MDKKINILPNILAFHRDNVLKLIFVWLKNIHILTKEVNAFVFDVLGLGTLGDSNDNSKLEGVMDLVLNLRQQARENKDWGTSDKIRDGLAAAGLVVKDGKEGTTWK